MIYMASFENVVVNGVLKFIIMIIQEEKYISKSGFRTKQEAKRAAVELESKINKGYKEEKTIL